MKSIYNFLDDIFTRKDGTAVVAGVFVLAALIGYAAICVIYKFSVLWTNL